MLSISIASRLRSSRNASGVSFLRTLPSSLFVLPSLKSAAGNCGHPAACTSSQSAVLPRKAIVDWRTATIVLQLDSKHEFKAEVCKVPTDYRDQHEWDTRCIRLLVAPALKKSWPLKYFIVTGYWHRTLRGLQRNPCSLFLSSEPHRRNAVFDSRLAPWGNLCCYPSAEIQVAPAEGRLLVNCFDRVEILDQLINLSAWFLNLSNSIGLLGG